jgi:Sulfatase
MGKDAIRALSLANLIFLPVWSAIIDAAYSMPSRQACVLVLINVFLVAFLFWSIVTLIRRVRTPLGFRLMRLAVPIALLSPLNALMYIIAPKHRPITELITIVLLVIIVSVFEVEPWSGIITRASSFILAVMFPFFLMALVQDSMLLTHFSDKPLAPRLEVKVPAGPRVLWLLFDEMDQGVAFSNRPPNLRLPELDRFREGALYATEAYPPADRTMISVPALLTGKRLSRAKPANPSDLTITLADSGRVVRWGRQANVFSAARSIGLNTALIGWYFPYSRMIGDNLTICASFSDDGTPTLRQTFVEQIESMLNTNPVVSILGTAVGVINDREARERRDRLNHTTAFEGVLGDTKTVAVDPGVQLIFAHFPIPHPPYIYDREKDILSIDGQSTYVDNLQLVDRSLGELRHAMEKAGVWDRTIVLATSDHWWRPELTGEPPPGNTNHRVPFILKLAGQMQGATYRSEFNTVVSHDLLIALLKNDISSPKTVMEWLDDHRGER